MTEFDVDEVAHDEDDGITGAVIKRSVRVFLLCDTSGSMMGSKIASLNSAVRDIIPALRSAQSSSKKGDIELSLLQFSTGAKWVVHGPTNVDDFQFADMTAGGTTDAGAAFKLLAPELDEAAMPQNAFSPVVVLVTDGVFTDNWQGGLEDLKKQRWFERAIKAAVSISTNEEQADRHALEKFVGPNHDNQQLIVNAHNAEDLARVISWATVNLSQQTMGVKSDSSGNEVKEAPPETSTERLDDDDDGWGIL